MFLHRQIDKIGRVSATMAKMMSLSPDMSSASFTPSPPPTPSPPKPTSLPVRTIPGSYGLPILGPIRDRLDYFWFQGPETFFRKRIEKHKSTVFRTNVPPTFPFFVGVNPSVVTVLDCKSFSHLFDMEIVEKKNVLVGDFMPSVKFTGDVRVCAYLDTSEPQHSKIKNFAMDILKRSSSIWVPTLVDKLDTMWDTIESKLSSSDSVSYFAPLQQFIFSFLVRCLIGADCLHLTQNCRVRLRHARHMARSSAPPHRQNRHITAPRRDLPPLVRLPFRAG
ncbi:hypothetical protein F0562_011145 [Nyssa sinensis]|uniref:Uncharacterized protein n=1 Tax=Nyssa sinensis TaxID=561372 RepID=A0A5J5A4F1_9ASTE|nr:hypothetical protein F0562_011145 [Nyssa sinensis]